MFLRRFLPTNRKAEGDRSSLRVDDRPSAYNSNVTTAPIHTLPGRDSVREPDETQSSAALSPNYIYYRIYAEDGAIPLKTPVAPSDPFLGRIKVRFVPPPRNAKVLKCSIAKAEDMKGSTSTTLFLTPYSKSPMGDADKVIGLGSTPQDPLALVAKMSDSERIALEYDGRASAAELDSESDTIVTPPEIRYVYYLLYADNYPIPSKVAIDPEEPSLGRIRADSIAPPHGPTSIKRCISRVERNPALAHADLFADTSCETPLEECHISILRTDAPGLSPKKPMAIVVPVEPHWQSPQSPDEPIAQWRAEALFDYPGSADDPYELSFKKGEHLDIIDKSGKWWDAVTSAGRRGIAPSNYLLLLI